MSNKPPVWIKNLLSHFLTPRLLEACLGDLEEKYVQRMKNNRAVFKARALYVLEALGFLRMAKRKNSPSLQTTFNMISHTLVFLSRLVRKDKSYYIVSLLGLTISLSSFLFIAMFINDELAYDKFHDKHERIFRLTTHLRLNDVDYNEATSQFPAAEVLRSEIKSVENVVRIYPSDLTLEKDDLKFKQHVIFADQHFFQVFSFQFLSGDAKAALTEPSSIVLTEAAAIRYFGNENVVGKTLQVAQLSLTISGVIANVPEQSHLKFDAVIPLSLQLNIWKSQTGLEGRENKWFWVGAYTYVLLDEVRNAEAVRAQLPGIVNRYFPDRYKQTGRFELQPLTDIHLKSSLDAELEPGGSMLYLKLFSIVALVIMLVSSINLINLSFFKISSRIQEIGIRKFLGQNSLKVVTQLSMESILIGAIAFIMALVVCWISLDSFNVLVQKNLVMHSVPNLLIAGSTFAMVVFISFASVIRPAMRYATRSASDLLLKENRASRGRMHNVLIGLQVCFSFVLLVFSFIISSQITFFKNKDLGFQPENIVVVKLNGQVSKNFEAFKTELKKSEAIVDVTGAEVPIGYNAWRFVPEGGSYEKPLMLPFTSCDDAFLQTMKIKLLDGNDFDPGITYDSLWPFLINKSAARELGWLDDPLNKKLEVFAPGTTQIMAKGKVIGMIEDYHFESLHNPVKPVVITLSTAFGNALVRTSGKLDANAIAWIEQTWKKFSDRPFEYEPLDRTLDKLYDNETKLSNIILFFTGVALYLTCYGLFAMSSLLFSSKLKEVAIRKVFGADHLAIIKQFYTRYAAFNLIAIMEGIPLVIYLGDLWLTTFQYRISLDSGLILKGALLIFLAGMLSVSYYLARVAFSNPIKFLRRE